MVMAYNRQMFSTKCAKERGMGGGGSQRWLVKWGIPYPAGCCDWKDGVIFSVWKCWGNDFHFSDDFKTSALYKRRRWAHKVQSQTTWMQAGAWNARANENARTKVLTACYKTSAFCKLCVNVPLSLQFYMCILSASCLRTLPATRPLHWWVETIPAFLLI